MTSLKQATTSGFIEQIVITPVAFREPPLLAATGVHQPWATRTIIEVVCSDGTTGLSETYGDKDTIQDLNQIASKLIGLSPWNVSELSHIVQLFCAENELNKCSKASKSPRTAPHLRIPRIFAAFEVAFLDAAARLAGVSLSQVLGGPNRAKVPFAAYLFFKPDTDPLTGETDHWGEVLDADSMVQEAKTMVSRHGFKSLKLKGGVLDPYAELEVLKYLHSAFPDLPLRIDPNGNWTPTTARQLLPHLEGLVEYLEDPVLGMDGMSDLGKETNLPFATNMCVTSFLELPRAIESKAIQILLADHHFWGGLRATIAMNSLCRTWNIGVGMHSNSHLGISLMAMAHVAAACDQLKHACDTHYSWIETDVVEGGKIAFDKGSIHVTDAPGLGVNLDRDALEAMSENYRRFAPERRDDVSGMKLLNPDWTPERPRF